MSSALNKHVDKAEAFKKYWLEFLPSGFYLMTSIGLNDGVWGINLQVLIPDFGWCEFACEPAETFPTKGLNAKMMLLMK